MAKTEKKISAGLRMFEDKPVIVDPPNSWLQITGLMKFLLFSQEEKGYWLPIQGDPIRRENDEYDRVYYTFQAVSALLDLGLPTNTSPIRKAFYYIDKLPSVSINYRPFYYLMLPLGLFSESKLIEFLRILQRYQISEGNTHTDQKYIGSFILPQGWINEAQKETTHWQGQIHPGGAYFHAIHLGYLLTQINRAQYPGAYQLAQDLLDKVILFLTKALDENNGRIPYADGTDSPDLTLWLYWLSDNFRIPLPENYSENIEWAINEKGSKFMARCFVGMNLVRLHEKNKLPSKFIKIAENHLLDLQSYLDSKYFELRENPRDAAIAVRAYLRIGEYFNDSFRYRLFSYLLQFFAEGYFLPEDFKDWT